MRPRQLIAFVLTLVAGAAWYGLLTDPPPADPTALAVRQLNGGAPAWDALQAARPATDYVKPGLLTLAAIVLAALSTDHRPRAA